MASRLFDNWQDHSLDGSIGGCYLARIGGKHKNYSIYFRKSPACGKDVVVEKKRKAPRRRMNIDSYFSFHF